ncbi:hypothetical protein BKA67DRAFT_136760 [Truncatella angustata]|uniref:Obg domain-containing protein n=1 Tax=Truncatella angustata TaxID=152316 RepID=A0A9P8UBG3_9PEZI|nr:uncharacterized protein BKA67DRAFT_136760 [Truncatella angustata]KAH6639922.1 hypothetical protein BKA67DRAFT_136760 [Truncatella angustata]
MILSYTFRLSTILPVTCVLFWALPQLDRSHSVSLVTACCHVTRLSCVEISRIQRSKSRGTSLSDSDSCAGNGKPQGYGCDHVGLIRNIQPDADRNRFRESGGGGGGNGVDKPIQG